MKNYKEMMFPILQFLASKDMATRQDVYDYIRDNGELTESEKQEKINSGMLLYQSRAGWALTHLSYTKKLNDDNRLATRLERGLYQATPLGLQLSKDQEAFNEWFKNIYSHSINSKQKQNYKNLMFPVLQFFNERKQATRQEVFQHALDFGFTQKDLTQSYAISGGLIYQSLLGTALSHICYDWALTDDNRLLKKVGRGLYEITPLGKKLAHDENAFWQWFSSAYNNTQQNPHKNEESSSQESEEFVSPIESIEKAYNELRDNLEAELLSEIMTKSPYFFEKLVLHVLEKIGYGIIGGNELTTNGADGGIDGIINEDELGLNTIYIQAKRWEGKVSRPELQKFVGAISDKCTKKGVFITTSDFTKEAKEYAMNLQHLSIALINGKRLAQLMIKHKIGIEVTKRIDICKLNSDFFDD